MNGSSKRRWFKRRGVIVAALVATLVLAVAAVIAVHGGAARDATSGPRARRFLGAGQAPAGGDGRRHEQRARVGTQGSVTSASSATTSDVNAASRRSTRRASSCRRAR